MTTLDARRRTPGLDRTSRSRGASREPRWRSHPGLVADVGADALAAGGKRLRPLLTFLSSRRARAAACDGAASRSSSFTWRRSFTTT